ncbi:MAG TPA: MinD/ParA family protein, partial [Intrasporangium sp.]|uniref:MinD/ParA family ATP-binding protein n=1 Tax=Intrasporangium sp. TaxID=1925024 RepID=UPI002B496CF2
APATLTPRPRKAALPKARPLLSLSLKGVLVPARWVPKLGRALAPVFWPPVVVVALIAVVVLDIRLLTTGDLGAAVVQVLTTPVLMLGLYGVLTLGGLIHESGHAAACSYSGGRPGAIGFGVYLIFPAFYTDVTDSYRLSRAGRLRTDLGGLYFNVLCLIVLASLYLTTGNGLFLLAAFIMHVEMLQQLIPIVRLDGYYVLADLAGVPDLFARVGPVLRSLRPGAERDPRVAELRPRARRTVIAWVCFVVPILLIGTLWLLWNLPFIIRTNIDAIRMQAMQWTAARDAGDVATVALASISILLLAVPLLGIAVLLDRLVRMLWRLVSSRAGRAGARRDRLSNEETSMTINQPAMSLQHNGTPHGSPSTSLALGVQTTGQPSSEDPGSEHPGSQHPGSEHPGSEHPGIGHQAQVEPRPVEPRLPEPRQVEPPPVEPPDIDDLPEGRDEDDLDEVFELTADAFRDELILPPEAPVPTRGWRERVYRFSGGAVNPGPGRQERRRMQLEERLNAPIAGSHRIVVMSRKGGVGKTTISFALGSTFASLRGDRVIAVDANPDAGNLAHRVAPPHDRAITDVLANLDRITTYSLLREYTSQGAESRLEVLASDDDPHIGMALGRDDYHQLIGLLDRFYNLIVLDTGTGILDSANQGLLEEADQLVLVLRPGVDGGRAAALTLDWLVKHDYHELVRQAVVVINGVREGVGAPIEPMVEHFEQRCRRVVRVPWDPALELGAQTRLSALRPETRDSLVEMTAAVADGFALTGVDE